jgi:hypothetical protein
MREGATDMDRRVRLLDRFGPGDHRVEMDELPVVFGLGFRPDFLHRFNGFAHALEAYYDPVRLPPEPVPEMRR